MTTINATKKDFVNLVNGIYKVQNLEGKKLAIVASKNLAILQENLKDIEEAGKPSSEFMEVAKKVNEIAQADSEDAKEQIEAIEKENEALIKERNEQIETLESMMDQELSLDLHTISEDDLPESINTTQISALIKIIE